MRLDIVIRLWQWGNQGPYHWWSTGKKSSGFWQDYAVRDMSVPGEVLLSNDGLTASFRADELLDVETLYTVRVDGVRDLAGNPMVAAFSSTFTTGDDPPDTDPPDVGIGIAMGV